MIKIYKIENFTKEVVALLPDILQTLEEIENYILFENEDIYEKIQIDEFYYLIDEEPWKIIGVMSLHKGWGLFDIAEHDDRVRIKNVFPDKICHIIGE
jgi:hypothetical protein